MRTVREPQAGERGGGFQPDRGHPGRDALDAFIGDEPLETDGAIGAGTRLPWEGPSAAMTARPAAQASQRPIRRWRSLRLWPLSPWKATDHGRRQDAAQAVEQIRHRSLGRTAYNQRAPHDAQETCEHHVVNERILGISIDILFLRDHRPAQEVEPCG